MRISLHQLRQYMTCPFCNQVAFYFRFGLVSGHAITATSIVRPDSWGHPEPYTVIKCYQCGRDLSRWMGTTPYWPLIGEDGDVLWAEVA